MKRRRLTSWLVGLVLLGAFWCGYGTSVWAAERITEIAAIRELPQNLLRRGLAVEVQGYIELLLPTRKLMYLRSESTSVAVILPDQPNRLVVGRKVRVEGVTIAQHQAHVRARQIHLRIGPKSVSKFRSLSVAELLADPPLHEVVEIRGIVHRRINRGSRLMIGLRDGSHSVQVQLFGVNVRGEPDRFYFSTSKIRAAVVPSPPNQSSKFQLMAHGWDCVRMEKPEPIALYQGPPRSVADILKVPASNLLVERAQIRGRIVASGTDGSAVLDDGSGKIVIVPRYRLNVGIGDVADVLGFTEVSPDGGSIRLEQTRTRKLRLPLELSKIPGRQDDWPRYLPEIENLKNVRFMGLNNLSNRPPVSVRGNVVSVDAKTGSFILQNETTGIEIVSHDGDVAVELGAHVQVVGHASPGRVTVVITDAKVTRLADQTVAQPIVPSPEGLSGGRYEAMWIALEGVGRTVGRANGGIHLVVARGDRKFTARLADAEPEEADHFVDARVRVEGVARAMTDEHGEVTRSEIMVGSITNITVKDPAPNAFTLAPKPIADLRRIRPGGGFARRYRTRGTVILAWPGLVYVADQNHYLRVRTAVDHGAVVGRMVNVIGFPNINPPHVELDDAKLSPVDEATPVTPRMLKPGERLTDGQRGELVELEARLVKQVKASPESVLIARFGAETFSAVLPESMAGDSFDNLVEGSLLRIRGVLTIKEDPSRNSGSAQLLLPDANAVTVLKLPPWWTVERLLSALGVMAMAIALVLLRSFRLQQKVHESENRLTSAALASPVAVAILSAEDGSFIEANDRFLSEFEFQRPEVVEQTLNDLGVWAEQDALKRLRRIAGQKDEHLHTNWRTQKGEDRSMVVSADEIEFDSQPCFVVSGVDVTEKAELLEQLRDSQKMEAVGQLAAGIAHDFNNLLTIINGNAEILGDELTPDSPLHEFNEDIHRAGTRAAELTKQLLAFSRRQVLREVNLELGEVVHSAYRMLRRLLPETIDLKFEKPNEICSVKADRGMLEQVLINLAVNARDAMGGSGTLTLEVDLEMIDAEQTEAFPDANPGGYVRLTVTDTGCGMDEPTQHRIFEPFFTTKDVGKGTGLGLATVYGIVRQHHGWISIRSEPGSGTSFFIHLPLAETVKEAGEDSATADHLRGSEKILLVEDEPDVRRIAGRVLTRAGYQVVEAEDGVVALDRWKQHKGEFDILVSDVLMPNNLTGVDLARRLIAKKPELRIVLISGYSGDSIDLKEFDQFGAVFVNKPVTQDMLLSRVRVVLDAETDN